MFTENPAGYSAGCSNGFGDFGDLDLFFLTLEEYLSYLCLKK